MSRLRPAGAPSVACSRSHPEVGLHLAAQRSQNVHELATEFHAHKGVQHRVKTAVEIAQAGSDYHGVFHRCSHLTGICKGVVGIERLHHQGDVVWCPADKEGHH